jgi:hypothetical protein
LGDVNDDGFVNSIDAELILQLEAHLLDHLPNALSGDVSHNGRINSADAQLVLQLDAGLIHGFTSGHGWGDRLRTLLLDL